MRVGVKVRFRGRVRVLGLGCRVRGSVGLG